MSRKFSITRLSLAFFAILVLLLAPLSGAMTAARADDGSDAVVASAEAEVQTSDGVQSEVEESTPSELPSSTEPSAPVVEVENTVSVEESVVTENPAPIQNRAPEVATSSPPLDGPPPNLVAPTAPSFIDPCGTENDAVVIPEDDYYTYTLNGAPVPAGVYPWDGQIEVMALPLYGTVIPEGTQTAWTYKLSDTPCSVVDPAITISCADGELSIAGSGWVAGAAVDVEASGGLFSGQITADPGGNFLMTFSIRVEALQWSTFTATSGDLSATATAACATPPAPTAPEFIDPCGRGDDGFTVPVDAEYVYRVGPVGGPHTGPLTQGKFYPVVMAGSVDVTAFDHNGIVVGSWGKVFTNAVCETPPVTTPPTSTPPTSTPPTSTPPTSTPPTSTPPTSTPPTSAPPTSTPPTSTPPTSAPTTEPSTAPPAAESPTSEPTQGTTPAPIAPKTGGGPVQPTSNGMLPVGGLVFIAFAVTAVVARQKALVAAKV